jgi:hypothetical protein
MGRKRDTFFIIVNSILPIILALIGLFIIFDSRSLYIHSSSLFFLFFYSLLVRINNESMLSCNKLTTVAITKTSTIQTTTVENTSIKKRKIYNYKFFNSFYNSRF